MTVHSLHIFDRRGKTLFTKRYINKKASSKELEQDEEEALSEQRKLVFGMLFSLREMAGSLSPINTNNTVTSSETASEEDKNKNNNDDDDEEGNNNNNGSVVADLQLVKTGGSTLYNYETVSGLRFALFTTAETSYGVTSSSSSSTLNLQQTSSGPNASSNSGSGGVGGNSGSGSSSTHGVAGSGSGAGGGATGGSSSGMGGGPGGSGGMGGGGGSNTTVGASHGMTNPAVTTNIRTALQHVYETIWVNCVVRSPMYRGSETDISSTNFEASLDTYLKGMAWFR